MPPCCPSHVYDPPASPLAWLLYDTAWPRRWDCGDWPVWLGTSTIGSDFIIFLCYLLIPLLGAWLLHRKPQLAPDRVLAFLCIAFVLACGITHLMTAAAFWWSAYHAQLVTKAITALVSVATVGRLWRRRHELAAYTSPTESAALVAAKEAAETLAQERQRIAVSLQVISEDRRRRNLDLEHAVAELQIALTVKLAKEDLDALRPRIRALTGGGA